MYVGLQKTTLVNFPRRVAAAVFLPGCNIRCPYCHNAELALASPVSFSPQECTGRNAYCTLEQVYSFLQKRKGIISALVISGGEPFMSPVLFDIIRTAKELSLAIKIDTNGLFPDRLFEVLHTPDLRPDMIALDIKTAPDRYNELLPKMSSSRTINEKTKKSLLKTMEILTTESISAALEIEYRTVLVPALVTKTEILEMAYLLPKNAVWRFAQFVPGICLNPEWNSVKPYTITEANELVKTAKTIIADTELR